MKKLFPILLLAACAAGIFYFMQGDKPAGDSGGSNQTASGTDSGGNASLGTSARPAGPELRNQGGAQVATQSASNDDEDLEEEITPATELYKSADAALAAVKKGSEDYDDLILEQFVELEKDCSWCPEFYKQVKDLMFSGDATEDQKSYYAELLAISGRVENVSTLVDAISSAQDEEQADIFAEALEVTIGGDDVVDYLGTQIENKNELLQESVVAAVTNHGSRKAVDLLYQHTVKKDDPDGYYSLGIGLGEVIPEEDSLPYLTEIMNKRNKFSHLGLKALLNYGTDGLRVVMDTLSNSSDAAFDRKMLEDAVDHVNYEDETEEYVRKLSETSQNEVVREFAKEILEDFDLEEDDGEAEEEEELE